MNKRYVLKNSYDEFFTCVLDPEQEEQGQWERVFSIAKGRGFAAERLNDKVKLVDYFHRETRASFQILSEEETQTPVSLTLTRLPGV